MRVCVREVDIARWWGLGASWWGSDALLLWGSGRHAWHGHGGRRGGDGDLDKVEQRGAKKGKKMRPV